MFRRRQQVSDPSIKLDPFWVVRNGNSDQLVKCIEQGLNVSKVRCGSGWTLLHRAAEQGYSEICEILIQNGCDVNSQSIWGRYTPLHCALANGWVETAFFLVQLGAHPWTLNKYGDDAVAYANKKGYVDIAETFRKSVRKRERAKHIEAQLHFGVDAAGVVAK